MKGRTLCFFLVWWSVLAIGAQTPHWIWHSDTNAPAVHFRKTFRAPPLTWNARLTVVADDSAEIFLNGVSVGRCTDPQRPMRNELSVRLNQGENVIAVKAENNSGPAGLLVHFNVNGQTNIVSDSSWLASTDAEPNWNALGFNAARWSPARTVVEHGASPWGDVLFRASATPAENLTVPDGFRVELIRSAEPDEGSWICMTFDDRGRLIISPQGDERPLLRLTLNEGRVEKIEKVAAPIRYAMGLLYAFDSLYANARGPNGAGLYRLVDKNKNDQFETNEVHLLKRFKGESEHGYHALALGPDKRIYVLNGNGAKLPEDISPKSPYRNYAEDALTGSRGQDEDQDGAKVPACHVLQTDEEGHEWKLWAGGMRNAYDMDFDEEGELFAFDSDNEWDWGVPWYKPTRILHLIPGGEYGWRDGSRMWADYYPDSLPPVAYVGIGSPTGVKFGTKSKFPEPYRRALYVMDWSYGRIITVYLAPEGSSYRSGIDPFLQGTPLNLTSLGFGPDGAMYFITGGRGTQSGLYRVSYVGAPTSPLPGPGAAGRYGLPAPRSLSPPASGPTSAAGRTHRKRMLSLQESQQPEAIDSIWPELGAPADRSRQFSARVALEAQPIDSWKNRALRERDPRRALNALLALARVGSAEDAHQVLDALRKFPLPKLPDREQLAKLRIIEIIMARHAPLRPEDATALIAELDREYPAPFTQLNAELSRILLHLNAPGAVSKTARLISSSSNEETQLQYIEQLRNIREGWALEDREAYFRWFTEPREGRQRGTRLQGFFHDVGRAYVDGAWFDRYLIDFRRQAIATLTPEDRKRLEPLLQKPIASKQNLIARNRSFVQQWKMEDLLPMLETNRTPDLARGRQALVDAQCLTCHRFGNDGGSVGPELTAVASKYTPRDILESIIEPSKVLNEQYQNHTAILKDGDSISGRLASDSEKEVILETDRLSGATEKIARQNLSELRPSPLSPMPEGLVSILTKEEILDMIAYLRTGAAKN